MQFVDTAREQINDQIMEVIKVEETVTDDEEIQFFNKHNIASLLQQDQAKPQATQITEQIYKGFLVLKSQGWKLTLLKQWNHSLREFLESVLSNDRQVLLEVVKKVFEDLGQLWPEQNKIRLEILHPFLLLIR